MNVQALCDNLVANDTALIKLHITLQDVDDDELKLILDAAKKNKTVKKVLLEEGGGGRPLSVPAALLLASLVSEHPEIEEIEFLSVTVMAFGPIAFAIQQNLKLTRLRLFGCLVTPNLVECIRWLLTENALESMALLNCLNSDGEQSFDISDDLLGSSSLKEIVLCDASPVFGWETFQVIPAMIRANQEFAKAEIHLSKTMTGRFELTRLVAQAAEGHASLNKLAITYLGDYDDETSPEDVINYVGSAEAVGTMLHNAPALRELSLNYCYMGPAGARHLVDGLSSKNSVVEKLDLSRNKLGNEEASIFARLLVTNQNLKFLVLSANDIGDGGALELAVALRQNNTLELLDLQTNKIGSDGANALAHALTRTML